MRQVLNLGLLRGGCAHVVIPVESSSGFSLVIRYEIACGIGGRKGECEQEATPRSRSILSPRILSSNLLIFLSVVVFPVIRSEIEVSTGETAFEGGTEVAWLAPRIPYCSAALPSDRLIFATVSVRLLLLKAVHR
jgi:hypothetical protein